MVVERMFLAAALVAAVLLGSAPARATEPAASASLGPRMHAQLELATLLLPTAGSLGTDRRLGSGVELAMPLGFHFHYRADRFALGAGASLALFALTSSPYAGTAELPRSHERGFFQIGPEARYYFREGGKWELWAGGKAGLVMLADRYATVPGDRVPSNYGVKTVSIRSEGLELMAGGGGAWRMTQLFTLGLDLRGGALAFPAAQRCSPLGDCTTMSGVFPALELGLAFGVLRDL